MHVSQLLDKWIYYRRVFDRAGPSVWNSLPDSLTNITQSLSNSNWNMNEE